MTDMKPKGGASIEAPSLRGLQGRSATGLNGQAAKEEVSALWQGGWMPENISGVPAGRSVFHLTSPFIGLLARGGESTARPDSLARGGEGLPGAPSNAGTDARTSSLARPDLGG